VIDPIYVAFIYNTSLLAKTIRWLRSTLQRCDLFLIKLRSASTEASYRVFVDESFGRRVQVMIKVQNTFVLEFIVCLFHFSLSFITIFKVKMILKTNTKKKAISFKIPMTTFV
jgi:hypothetical protein